MTGGPVLPGGDADGAATWLEDKGIPARRFFSLAASHGLSEQVARLDKESVQRLQAECDKRDLPFAILVDKDELVACLTAALVWERLPTAELRRELRQWSARAGAPELPARGGDSAQQSNEDLAKQLTSCLWGAVREARGLPAERLGANVAEALFKEVLRLEARSPAAIEAEYKKELRKLDVPPEDGASRQYHLDCLTRILVMEELPMAELRKECKEYGMQVRNGEQRHELAQCLFVCSMCREPWEARGILADQLGPRSALKVAERHRRLEELSDEELEAEHEALGLPKEAELQPRRVELLSRLKAVSIWQEMPVEELLEECRRVGLPADDLEVTTPEQRALRRRVVELLVTGICLTPWEATRWEERGIPVRRIGDAEAANAVIRRVTQLEAMDQAALRAEYDGLGLPPEAGRPPKNRAELLDRLRCAAVWRELPVNELRRECQELSVSNGGLGSDMSDAEKRCELAGRLMVAKWADAWMSRGDVPVGRLGSLKAVAGAMREVERLDALGAEELRREYADIGLPAKAFNTPKDRKELLDRLKRVIFWRAMPLDELREECMKLSVSFRTENGRGASSEQQRAELLERLLMAACADAWEARGIPVKRLSNIQTAADLAEQWDSLEEMGSKDLQSEYGKLGLPREAEVPKVLELLPRLKLASMWRALPLSELQKECRKLGAAAGGDQQEAVQRLIMASWGASQNAGTGEEGPGRPSVPGNARELLKETAKHFETMGLPANANINDLKKAYHKLVLLHHPDKNPEKPQEEAKIKFQEVTEAYEALCDFMKQKF